MNQRGHTRSQREADLWFARRLDPAGREADLDGFADWRRDPRNAAAFEAAGRLWDQMEPLKASARLRAIVDEPEADELQRPWSRWSKPALLAAGIAAAAVVYFFALFPGASPRIHATAVGEQRVETLADGSQLVLNTNTSVAVEYSRKRRQITLRSGEVLFEVKPDPSRPFVVTAGRGEVAVLGTRFQVRNEAERVAVTLLEGSVRVARRGQSGTKVLVPGQQALYSDEFRGIATRNVDVSGLDSWTRGRLEFRFTPLARVVEEANRYSPYRLRIADPGLDGMPVSGSFRAGDTAGIAAALAAAYPVDAEYGAEGIVLRRR